MEGVAGIAAHILDIPAWLALLVVFALPAAEASTFLGFVFPGEISCLLGGVLAFQGKLNLVVVIVVAIAGAVIGDNIGYAVGHRYGDAILRVVPRRFVKDEHIERSKAMIRRLGGRAVFAGRFTAALRALVPGICGMSHVPYRTFLVWNFAGGALWAGGCVVLGYLAGNAWRRVAGDVNYVGFAVLGAVVVAAAVFWVIHHYRQRRAREHETSSARTR